MPAIKKITREGTEGPAIKHGDTAKIVWRMISRKTKEEVEMNVDVTGDCFDISDDSIWQYQMIGHKVNSQLIVKVDEAMQVTASGEYIVSAIIIQVGDYYTQA